MRLGMRRGANKTVIVCAISVRESRHYVRVIVLSFWLQK